MSISLCLHPADQGLDSLGTHVQAPPVATISTEQDRGPQLSCPAISDHGHLSAGEATSSRKLTQSPARDIQGQQQINSPVPRLLSG